MSAVDEKQTLLDVPAYSMRQIDELATSLIQKLEMHGDDIPTDEWTQLRLLRTLLDGFA